jgi:GWxTD domain-containing protein
MIRTRAIRIVLVIGLAIPGSLFAQSPAQRDSLAQFWDSTRTADSAALIALEQQTIERAKLDRNNAMLHLRLGFIAVRMGMLGSTSRYDDAGSEFEWTTELEPRWPYGWYGLGLAEVGLADTLFGVRASIRSMLGVDPMQRAITALVHSTELDSSFVPGMLGLVSVYGKERFAEDSAVVINVVRRGSRTSAATSPPFLLAWGRLEGDMGFPDSAAVAFRKYLEQGGNHDVGQFELARALLASGHLDAAALYYGIAGTRDTDVIAGLRHDVQLIAGDSGISEFDSAGSEGRTEYLARFWSKRDRYDMRKDGERLAEHYRRMYYARHYFRRLPRKRRFAGFEDYRQTQLEFDARGEIYIRHGEPTERVEVPDYCAVSWRYVRGDGDLMFHFLGNPASRDYSLAASVLKVCDPGILWLSKVHTWSPRYARLVNAGPNSQALLNLEQEMEGVRDIREGVTTDRYELTYDSTLPAISQVAAVGRGDGGSLVHFAIAIPGEHLKADTTGEIISYLIRTRIVVLNQAGDVLARSDLTRRHRTDIVVAPGQYLTVRDTLTVPPGMATYRIAVEQDSTRGGVFPKDSLAVGRFGFGSDSLSISDLVLGSRAVRLVWMATRADTVFFNPVGTWRENSSMEMYYEIYGLAPGSTYRTQLSVRKGRRGRRERTLSFTDPAGNDVTRVRRTVDLARLGRGEYVMEVEVTGADGRTVTQSRAFRVVK